MVNVFERQRAHDNVAGARTELLQTERLAQQPRGWRRLHGKGERAVSSHGDPDAHWHGQQVGGARIEVAAKVHCLDSLLAESGADGGSWGGFARCDQQLDGVVHPTESKSTNQVFLFLLVIN